MPDRAHTMRAIVQDTYGTADAWRLEEIDQPHIAANEVLVKVHAAALDRGTWHNMTGLPYLGRLALGLRTPKNRVPGLDLAGTVEAVGSAVTRFSVGDTVYGVGRGSFADYTAARENKLAHKPSNLTFEQAAVVPVSGCTAIQGLTDVGRVAAGQHVLIVGASGGVGTYAVQIAKALGAKVTGVSSTAKVELVRSLGADHVIDYTRDDFARGAHRYDLILDIGGNSTLSRLRLALKPKGPLVIVGGEGGGRWTGGIDRHLRALAWSPFVRQRMTSYLAKQRTVDLERLTKLIEAGALTPSIDRVYPLAEAAVAMRHLEAGHAQGKLALAI
jgi:NADPH:quinone reductase-like Zn-dependent oxidoreductase